MKKFFAKDAWWDEWKLGHFFGGGYLAFVEAIFVFFWSAMIITTILTILWEIKDALVRREKLPDKWKWLGGDGFSYKDAVWTQAGFFLTWLVFVWIARSVV